MTNSFDIAADSSATTLALRAKLDEAKAAATAAAQHCNSFMCVRGQAAAKRAAKKAYAAALDAEREAAMAWRASM